MSRSVGCLAAAVLLSFPSRVAAQREVLVRGAEPEVRLEPGAVVSSLVFSRELTQPCAVHGTSFDLAPGARVVYEKSAGVANQRVAAGLVLRGDATFANDNGWTHMAHMLRFEGPLSGSGTLTIDGAGDGGVVLAADSRASFRGRIRVVGGNLVVGHSGALGTADVPTTLTGGRLSLFSGETGEPLVFAGDAGLHTGVGVALLGDVTIAAGATASVDTGGGNPGRLLGRLQGDGELVFRGGGRNPQLARVPFTLTGARATTLRGRITVARGTLALAKPPGVTAVAGDLWLGGGSNFAAVRLDADEQIADGARLVFVGEHRAVLWSDGHTETLGPLVLGADGVVRLGEGQDRVRFGACEGEEWRADRELIVEGWAEDDTVSFETLTLKQAARIGFRDPAGRAAGLYRAVVSGANEVQPGDRVQPSPRNPFPVGPDTDAARAASYESSGLARLCGSASALPEGGVVSFFGDSITWQHGFLGKIERALAQGEGTRGRRIELRNRGINGGGVRDLRDGAARSARAGGRPGGDADAPQAAFADVLAVDRPAAVVVFIGINDVNWRRTTEAEFTSALTTLVRTAREASAAVVLATPLLGGERPDGSNAKDAGIDRFAQLTRDVAAGEAVTLVDLRRAAVAWLRNHNRRLRLDGSLEFDDLGHLTYDGIHPTDRGNALIAELLGAGLQRALAP